MQELVASGGGACATDPILSYHAGDWSGETAMALMDDLRTRLVNRVQLATDGYKAPPGIRVSLTPHRMHGRPLPASRAQRYQHRHDGHIARTADAPSRGETAGRAGRLLFRVRCLR